MDKLEELHVLDVDMPTLEGGEVELPLVEETGTEFENTKDLEVKNYASMMASENKELFQEGIEVEHEKFIKFNCFEEVLKTDLRPKDKVVSRTWAGRFRTKGGLPRCRIVAQEFRQKDSINYDASDCAAPIICDIKIRICLVLCIMAGWAA